MKKDLFETYLGKRIHVVLFDGSSYRGYLHKTHDSKFKNDPNLYLPSNRYFLSSTVDSLDCISCLFRSSHVKKLENELF